MLCGGSRYKRYRLSSVKDFSSLFFPDKENLLKILDHFENKTGGSASQVYHFLSPRGFVHDIAVRDLSAACFASACTQCI